MTYIQNHSPILKTYGSQEADSKMIGTLKSHTPAGNGKNEQASIEFKGRIYTVTLTDDGGLHYRPADDKASQFISGVKDCLAHSQEDVDHSTELITAIQVFNVNVLNNATDNTSQILKKSESDGNDGIPVKADERPEAVNVEDTVKDIRIKTEDNFSAVSESHSSPKPGVVEGRCLFQLVPTPNYENARANTIDGLRLKTPATTFPLYSDYDGNKKAKEIACRTALTQLDLTLRHHFNMGLSDFDGIEIINNPDGGSIAKISYVRNIAFPLRTMMGSMPRYGGDPLNLLDKELTARIKPIAEEFASAWVNATEGKISTDPVSMPGFPDSNKTASKKEFFTCVDKLIDGRSFYLGELCHDDKEAKLFLEKNLGLMVKRGYSTIYIETLPREAQSLVDDYLKTDKPMDKRLEFMLKMTDLYDIVTTAKKVGMRVVSLDSPFTDNMELRTPAFNYCAIQVIEGDAVNRGRGSFVIFGGDGHGKSCVNDYGKNYVGIAAALGIRSAAMKTYGYMKANYTYSMRFAFQEGQASYFDFENPFFDNVKDDLVIGLPEGAEVDYEAYISSLNLEPDKN
jgi:hypothetical protein